MLEFIYLAASPTWDITNLKKTTIFKGLEGTKDKTVVIDS